MNWYTAKIIFRIISGDGNHCAQFDEQLRLIEADCEASAITKANSIGVAAQDSFLNAKKETVRWEFIAVTEVNGIADLADGNEVYYRLYETPEPEVYIAMARNKSALLGCSA
ncbi:DUF4288 domain-containing protein [Mucilaginibacter sp. BJC16-A38]|uniref:DUF4288 domain-containing protein n=1 Tax=Mucilaginibacter phenanthrenivorans TaxID=1234842 RepID=UPI002157620E|nr:DUF4288 domain-containing protein [Mucilaginibacter phenanthrenivorans]MCR8557401.1 DUF4288 domain-containing protein [Mucilaginibacter phenanthrenivorans]